MNWFYIDESIQDGDRRQGPLSFEELQSLEQDGKISDATLVWHRGLENWISWAEAKSQEPAETNDQTAIDEAKLEDTVRAILREQSFSKERTYAGFFIRGAAIFIDWFLLGILWQIFVRIFDALKIIDYAKIAENVSAVMDQFAGNTMSADFGNAFMEIPGMSDLFLLWFVIQTLYFICFNGFLSATPGKLLLRLRIERADTSKLGISGAIVRYIFSLLTQATFVFYGIGYILAMIDPQKRALHDFFARTRVVRLPVRNPNNEGN